MTSTSTLRHCCGCQASGSIWGLLEGLAIAFAFCATLLTLQRFSLDPPHQVRKTPSWPRSWANASAYYRCTPTGMYGQTCIFWANLTPSSLQNWKLPPPESEERLDEHAEMWEELFLYVIERGSN
jgi:hypothetical protein